MYGTHADKVVIVLVNGRLLTPVIPTEFWELGPYLAEFSGAEHNGLN